jgi:hypothetical protein
MAAPNIVNVSSIIANTSQQTLSSNVARTLVNNPANSNAVYKVNTIMVANKDSTNSITVNVSSFSSANLAGIPYALGVISIPSNSTLTLIDKSTAIYLLENQSIGANCVATSASNIDVTTSWEQIS